MSQFSYIDIFAGCGGLSLGLHNAGWKGLFAIEKSKDAFKFETVVLDNGTVDLALTLPLTERVIVKRNDDGTLNVSFPDEPQHEKALPSQLFKMIDSKTGQTLAEWQSAEPEEQYF